MVLHLGPGESWEWSPDEGQRADVTFASASSPEAASSLGVYLNGDELDRVALPVPHSWWPLSGQAFCPPLGAGDELRLLAGDAPVDVRLDLLVHEA